MPTVWLLSLAVFAPLLAGVATLFWPRRWYRPRVWVAAIGPAVAFALVLSAGVVEHPLGVTGEAREGALEGALEGAPKGEGAEAGTGKTSPFAPGSSLSGVGEGASSHPAPGTRNPDPGIRNPAPGSRNSNAAAGVEWIPTLHINLAFFNDGLGVFFALLVAGIGLLIVLYARAYFGRDPDELYRFFPTLGFFTTAMLGVVLADYFLLTLLFWEMTSISSFLLIGWDRYDKRAVKLGMQAFFTTGLGGMGLFGGLLILGNETGVWRWSELMAVVSAGELSIDTTLDVSNRYMWAFVLMLVGAGAKSAQFPFHYWLPGAMAAPTPVSAFLHSATMVKAGVFLLGRLLPVLGLASAGTALALWPWVVIPLGAVTMLYGAVVAIQQHDLKRIFAYTTVSQLGLLTCMYGLGSLAYHGSPNLDFDITQIANHAFYKAPLFIVAGALGHVASRNLTQLHGAWKHHKAMVLTMLLAGWALAALPGSISFQAKELFVDAVLHSKEALGGWMWVLLAMTLGTAICNVAIFVRLVTTLLGLKGSMAMPHHEPRDQYEQPEIEQAGTTEAHSHDAGHGHDSPAGAGHGVAAGAHDHHHHETGLWGVMLWLPALLIVSLQYVGGLATPLWNAAFAPLEQIAAGHYIGEKFGGVPDLWQVATNPGPAMIVSLLAVVGGVMLGYSKLLRGAIVDWADRIYPAMYWLAVTGGGRAFRVVQTGYLRHYLVMTLGFLLIAFAGVMYLEPAMLSRAAEPFDRVFEYWPGLILGAIVCGAALALPIAQSRVLRVLVLGACGFTVVGIYIVYKAPDLALTQLMFELISVFLFLLVLRLLPNPVKSTNGGRTWRVAISVAVGVVFAIMTLVAAPSPERPVDLTPLGEGLAQTSYEPHPDPETGYAVDDERGGGGKNIVNVILVDFRGFDTLGEITVLCLAAMGVWSMIPRRRRGSPERADDTTPGPPEWDQKMAAEPLAEEGASIG